MSRVSVVLALLNKFVLALKSTFSLWLKTFILCRPEKVCTEDVNKKKNVLHIFIPYVINKDCHIPFIVVCNFCVFSIKCVCTYGPVTTYTFPISGP